eukprot:scaffold847_cov385-Prasinococcus_capsulatus_cf.AAC.17
MEPGTWAQDADATRATLIFQSSPSGNYSASTRVRTAPGPGRRGTVALGSPPPAACDPLPHSRSLNKKFLPPSLNARSQCGDAPPAPRSRRSSSRHGLPRCRYYDLATKWCARTGDPRPSTYPWLLAECTRSSPSSCIHPQGTGPYISH